MTGVWAGVVSNIVWIHGNSSEPFMITLDGALEVICPNIAEFSIEHVEELCN